MSARRPKRRERSRNWFGTIWNEEDKNTILEYKYKYLIISADDHTEEGQLHWHCLLIFHNARVRPSTNTVHWEIPKCVSEARKYCLDKGEPLFEDGVFNIACQIENDWFSFVNECKTKTPKDLIDGPYSQMYAKYTNFAGIVHMNFMESHIIDGELKNLWLYGAPGTGKTRWAWQKFPSLFVKGLNKWWDGYSGQDEVLLDDWGPQQNILVTHLKIWADRYPFNAEIKGSAMRIRPKLIIVTSNYRIEECFENEQDISAIKRRFKVHHFSTFGDPDELRNMLASM